MVIITQKQNYQKHYYPEESNGICVVRRKGESVEDLIKRFRKKWSKSGVARELKERMYFEKPSAKKKRKKMQSIRMIEREQEKLEEMQATYEKNKNKRRKLKFKERKERNHDSGDRRQDYSSVYESDQD